MALCHLSAFGRWSSYRHHSLQVVQNTSGKGKQYYSLLELNSISGQIIYFGDYFLTLAMLRLLSSKAQGRNIFWKPVMLVYIGKLLLSTLRFFASFRFGQISDQQHKD